MMAMTQQLVTAMKTDATALNVSILLTGVIMFGCAGHSPVDIGLKDGRLAPCPGRPNCVVSQGTDKRHHIDPIAYEGEKPAAVELIQQVVQELDGTRIVVQTDDYLHVEFKSKLMGFVDDVEFYFPDSAVIHMRSASRVGYSDFGANRRRLEKIRKRFQNRLSKDNQT
jgi:uncharacterized protein (DUF1499 family)